VRSGYEASWSRDRDRHASSAETSNGSQRPVLSSIVKQCGNSWMRGRRGINSVDLERWAQVSLLMGR
jgi:hypothetical protein